MDSIGWRLRHRGHVSAHPRTQKQIREHGLESYFRCRRIDYERWRAGIQWSSHRALDFLPDENARMVVTDPAAYRKRPLRSVFHASRFGTIQNVRSRRKSERTCWRARKRERSVRVQRQLEFRGGTLMPENGTVGRARGLFRYWLSSYPQCRCPKTHRGTNPGKCQ